MSKLETVLLTGGAGYIGTHTAVEFLNAGVNVVIADDYSNSSPKAIERLEQLTGKQVVKYAVNMCDKAAVRRIFEENRLDAIVHFAGYKAVGESKALPIQYYRNNVDSALVVCELMQEFGVNQLVFSSSATVYGDSQNVPFEEDEPTSCTNPYGWTKLTIERILTDFVEANKEKTDVNKDVFINDLSVTLLRYFNPIGAHASGLIGEDPRGPANNLMPHVARVAVGVSDHLNVFGNDYPTKDGTCVRDYIHVVDLAKGHLLACQKATPGLHTYNLGTGKGYSVLEVVETFERVNGIRIPYVFAARRPGDVPESYANPARANRELGWSAEHTLEDMCRDVYNWQKNNPQGYGD